MDAILKGTGGSIDAPVRDVLRTVYLDDAAGTLARHGVALRHRAMANDGAALWGVKALASTPSGGSWDFVEWEIPGRRGALPPGLARLCAALGVGEGLRPIAELVTEREIRRVHSGAAHGEVCIDRVTVRTPDEARFLEVEFESLSETLLARARRSVEEMVDPPPASPGSKLEAALGGSRRVADPAVVALIRHEVCNS